MKSLKELCDERLKLFGQNRALLEAAEREGRQLDAGEREQYDARDAEIDKLSGQVQGFQQDQVRKEKAAKQAALMELPLPRQTQSSQPGLTPGAAGAGNDGASLTFSFKTGRKALGNLRRRQAVLEPGSAAALRAAPEYRRRFNEYLASGVAQLGLQNSKDTKGGYLAPIVMAAELIKFVDNMVFMRQLANVLPPIPEAISLGCPSYDTDPGDADWTAEIPASDITEDDNVTLGKRELMPHLLTKLLKVGEKLLRVSTIDVESFLVERLGYVFGVALEKGYMTGTGNKQPLGVFTADANGISTGRDTTASSTTAFTMDDLFTLKYSVKPQYQQRGSWLVSRTFMRNLRKLKDGIGQYFMGINGQPDMLLDRPVFQSEYVPATFTTGLYVAIFGDFSRYWIVDSLQLTIRNLIELFALKNQVGILGKMESDGMPVLEEAFARLKLA